MMRGSPRSSSHLPGPTTRHPCVLCEAVDEALSPGDPGKPYNRLLREPAGASRFVVMPTVGPLVEGHVMIVSREHCHSLAAMGPEAIAEYEALTRSLIAGTGGVLEAEHGGTTYGNAGSCVDHAHVHLLPGVGEWCAEALSAHLRPLDGVTSLDELARTTTPYVFLRSGSRFRAFDATTAPSMLLRRVIAEHDGRDDWDWDLFPRLDLVQRSIDYWASSASLARK